MFHESLDILLIHFIEAAEVAVDDGRQRIGWYLLGVYLHDDLLVRVAIVFPYGLQHFQLLVFLHFRQVYRPIIVPGIASVLEDEHIIICDHGVRIGHPLIADLLSER